MNRYIAPIPLRPYLATLPITAYSFDTRWDEAKQLARVEIVGFEGRQIENVELKIADAAEVICEKWRREGKLSQLVVRAKKGDRVRDLSRLKEPIHVAFANWLSLPQSIVEFTRKFGVLSECPYTESGEFEFEIREWTEYQKMLRLWWRYRLGCKPALSATELEWEQMISRISARSIERREAPKTFLEDIKGSLQGSVTIDLSAGRKGIAAEVVAPDLWTYMVLLLIRENPKMLRVCANEESKAPYCTPYFVAQRKDQKYCSSDCSQAVATRRWWSQHGNDWRRTRQQKKRGKR